MRKPIIAGNWKMNKTVKETEEFVREFLPLVKGAGADVVLCVPYLNIARAVELTKGTNVKIGAQNVHWADNGAFTGEVSATQLVEAGAEYVVVGHSERRQYFGETDETVSKRAVQALKYGLVPIVCIGEVLAERQAGKTNEVNERQFKAGMNGISAEDAKKVVIAYEPVWAIGTGLTATDEQAEEAIAFIRAIAEKVYGKETANAMRIQYGGSMNASNCTGLMKMPNIDGGLIGGASLKPSDFSIIVKSAE
jgi:triosephosphate isomerase